MKGFEWLLEEPDLNRLARNSDYVKINEITDIVFLSFKTETLIEAIARFARHVDHLVLLKFIVDRGFDINTPLGINRSAVIVGTMAYDCQRFLIDHGAKQTQCYLHKRSIQFIASRNAARLGAFAVLRALRTINRNVASIIARVVWALRAQTI